MDKNVVNAFSPKVFIFDALNSLNKSLDEFIKEINDKEVILYLKNKIKMNEKVSKALENYFNVSSDFWLNLEKRYEDDLKLIKENKLKEKEEKILSLIPRSFLNESILLDKKLLTKEEIIKTLKEKLKLNSLIELLRFNKYVFNKTHFNKKEGAKEKVLKNVRITLAIELSKEIEVKEFNEKAFKTSLKFLKSLSLYTFKDVRKTLESTLNECGIKLVILPYLNGSNLRGFTRFNKEENNYLVAINDCGKDLDKFWFTLFHELGHIYYKNNEHLKMSLEDNSLDEDEIKANEFAENSLIDKEHYLEFILNNNFSIRAIKDFALKEEIDVSLVIGRLQKDKFIPWSYYNEYKKKYLIL